MTVIVAGIDTSQSSERALRYALAEAGPSGGEVVLAHVIPWSPFSFQTLSENEHRHREREREIEAAQAQLIDPAVARAAEAGVAARAVVRHGNPAETLLDIVREEKADAIVVGRSGDSGLKAAIFGSVANRLAHESPVPVTVVP